MERVLGMPHLQIHLAQRTEILQVGFQVVSRRPVGKWEVIEIHFDGPVGPDLGRPGHGTSESWT